MLVLRILHKFIAIGVEFRNFYDIIYIYVTVFSVHTDRIPREQKRYNLLRASRFTTAPTNKHVPWNAELNFPRFLFLFQRGIARQISPQLSSQHTPAASVRESGREIDDFGPALFRHTSLDCLFKLYITYIYNENYYYY